LGLPSSHYLIQADALDKLFSPDGRYVTKVVRGAREVLCIFDLRPHRAVCQSSILEAPFICGN